MNSFEDILFLQSASRVCFGIAIAAAILAIVLFFLLDIREVFLIETGRAQRKTVAEMNEKNLRTGKLRDDTESDLDKSGGMTVKSTVAGKTLSSQNQPQNPDWSGAAAGHQQYAKPSGSTMEFSSQGADGHYYGRETAVLGEQGKAPASNPSFRVTQKTIITHTDEMIHA